MSASSGQREAAQERRVDRGRAHRVHTYAARASSTAIDFVSMTTPPFDAQYAALYGVARRPATDARLTIAPRRSTKAGTAAWLSRNVPVRFTSMMRRQSSSGIVVMRCDAAIPADVDEDVEPPELSTVAATARRTRRHR